MVGYGTCAVPRGVRVASAWRPFISSSALTVPPLSLPLNVGAPLLNQASGVVAPVVDAAVHHEPCGSECCHERSGVAIPLRRAGDGARLDGREVTIRRVVERPQPEAGHVPDGLGDVHVQRVCQLQRLAMGRKRLVQLDPSHRARRPLSLLRVPHRLLWGLPGGFDATRLRSHPRELRASHRGRRMVRRRPVP